MTLANKITIGRILLIPVCVGCIALYSRSQPEYRYAALALFLAAALSDFVDGYIARAWKQESRLGRALDPMADKLLVNLAFVFLAVNEEFQTPVPKWIPVCMLGRDIIIVVGVFLIKKRYGKVEATPHLAGKINTMVQLIAIVVVLLELPPAIVMGTLYVTLVTVAVSLADYVRDGVGQVTRKRVA